MIVNKYNGGGGGGGSYTLPTATASRLGGIKVGSGLTVENDGTLSTSGGTYEIPVASQNTLGGIKVGTGLAVDSGGTLSVSGGTGGDFNKLMAVSDFPESAETGDVGAIYQPSGYTYPEGVTFEKGSFGPNGEDGGRFVMDPTYLTGYTPDNMLFLGTVVPLEGSYNGQRVDLRVQYEDDGGSYYFGAIFFGDLEDPVASFYTDEGDVTAAAAGIGYSFTESGGTWVLDIYNDENEGTSEIYFIDMDFEPETRGVYQFDGTAWNPVKPNEYYLNYMTNEELYQLYNDIWDSTGGGDNDAGDELFDDYKFYIMTDDDGQKWSEAFFSHWENQDGVDNLFIASLKPVKPEAYGCGIKRVWAKISPEGSISISSDGLHSEDIESAGNDISIRIDNEGNITIPDSLSSLSSLAVFNKVQFVYQNENVTNHYSSAPLDYFHRETNDQDELVEHIGCTINIDGVIYRGRWTFSEWGWGDTVAPESWEAVAGYVDLDIDITDMKNPKLLPNEDEFFEYYNSTNVLGLVKSLFGGRTNLDKAFRIHMMQDDGEGGYEDAGYPVQYGRLSKISIDSDTPDVSIEVDFNFGINAPNELTYRMKFSCTVADLGDGNGDSGVLTALEVFDYNIPEYLMPVDAWIPLKHTGTTLVYDSGMSVYSLDKFAVALFNKTTATAPIRCDDTGGANEVWSPIFICRNNMGTSGDYPDGNFQFGFYADNISIQLYNLEWNGTNGAFELVKNTSTVYGISFN